LAQEPAQNAPITYADAGVNIDRANRTKQRIKYLAHKTFTKGLGNLTKDYEWRPESMERDANWFRCLDHWHEFRKSSNGAR